MSIVQVSPGTTPSAYVGGRPPVLSDRGETIRCPKCNWVPRQKDQWRCKCGHAWNTLKLLEHVLRAATSGT